MAAGINLNLLLLLHVVQHGLCTVSSSMFILFILFSWFDFWSSDLPPKIYFDKGSSGIIDLTHAESVGGCICCTVRGDLIAGLKKILKRLCGVDM